MVGIFVFPVNPTDKDYKFKKFGRKILDYSDEELLSEIRPFVKGIEYCLHHKDDLDKVKDPNEWVTYFSKYLSKNLGTLVKCKNGFTSEDKEYYVKFIINDKEWFKNKI